MEKVKESKKPPIQLQDYVYYAHAFLVESTKTSNVKEALASSNSKYWQEAINNEYKFIIKITLVF